VKELLTKSTNIRTTAFAALGKSGDCLLSDWRDRLPDGPGRVSLEVLLGRRSDHALRVALHPLLHHAHQLQTHGWRWLVQSLDLREIWIGFGLNSIQDIPSNMDFKVDLNLVLLQLVGVLLKTFVNQCSNEDFLIFRLF
jgi:hypothetical protein